MSSLQPLYDVKERLEYAAIAGTGLLDEDFRLRRAAEALRPLAAASPVLGKISDGLDALLSAPADQRPGLLLDVLGLADAVAYTQGDSGLAGDLRDLPAGGGTYHQISYSQLQPLLAALTTTGGGRLGVIKANWEAHPEYFSDFRVLPVLVNDLGDSHREIGELIANILKTMGPAILPALMAGFDPKGKKDMVRRVQIMEDISGSGENDFYLSHIPEAERGVRAALIFALRHDEGNVEKLIELSVTEKGSAKKMALWALARMDCPAVLDYWLQSEKTRELALQYAAFSTTRACSAVVAEALDRWLVPYEADSGAALDCKGSEAFEALLKVLPGKSGPEICGIYRRMAALRTASGPGNNGRFPALALRSKSILFSEAAVKTLRASILFHPAPDLLELAVELWEKNRAYAPAGITAALLSNSAAEAFELTQRLLHNKSKREPITNALNDLIWDQKIGRTAYHVMLSDPVNKQAIELVRPLVEPLDRRWFKVLITLGPLETMSGGSSIDRLLVRLTPLDDAELCCQVGEYLYNNALNCIGLDVDRLWELRRLGWQKCEGLAVSFCESQKALYDGMVMNFIANLPGDREAKQREGRAVVDLIANGKFFLRNGTLTKLKAFIENDL